MYDPFSPRIKGKPLPSLFTERNERIHSALRKPIASAYNITTVLDHEPLVDTMIEKLLSKLKPFAADSQPCDIGSWLRWCKCNVESHQKSSPKLTEVQLPLT